MPAIPIAIETPNGTILADLLPDQAPVTVDNFLAYVDGGSFDGGRFHRTVTAANNSNSNLDVSRADKGMDVDNDAAMPNDTFVIEVIQGGINPERQQDLKPPIVLERTSDTGITHTDGALSMARRTADSAVSDFFICINDQPSLDFGGMRNVDGQGFAAFGRVTQGMDIVRAIQMASARGQQLDPVVPIISIRRA